MISDFKHLASLFEEINHKLRTKIDVYLIGGIVLLSQGLKPATKDIDLILIHEKEHAALSQTLHAIGFQGKIPTNIYRRLNLGQIYVRDDFRLDVFFRTVCKRFSLSERMRKRAKRQLTLPHLTVSLCSNEDVFLLKTFTEREGDLEDCIALARRGLDWTVIIQELKEQIRLSGQDVWITWVGERFDILVEKGLNIPIMDELDRVHNDYFHSLETAHKNTKGNQ